MTPSEGAIDASQIARLAVLATLLMIGLSPLLPGGTRPRGLLTDAEKAMIVASDNTPVAGCVDINESNCSATTQNGALTPCGTAYGVNTANGCTGFCTGNCDATSQSTLTSIPGKTVVGPVKFTNGTPYPYSPKTCGFVKADGICTGIPNGNAGIAGSGCYCRGGNSTANACGIVLDTLPKVLPANCVQPAPGQ